MTHKNENNANLPTIHPTHEIAKLALEAVVELVHSTQLTSKTFTRPLENGGGELAEIVIGEQETENETPHCLLSTYGVGGVETDGKISVAELDNQEFPYHAEFYMVANSVKNAEVFAEQLVNLSFVVATQQKPLFPGMMLGTPDPEVSFLLSERPLGVLSGHGHVPVLVEDFALCFVAVTPVYGEEIKMLQNEEEFKKFTEWYTGLGGEAYSPTRPRYTASH